MILIVDSGSTKTDWCFATSATAFKVVHTGGINPAVQAKEEIESTVADMLSQASRESISCGSVAKVSFYGAGCTEAFAPIVGSALRSHFITATISVHSDLLAAARALCGTAPGIACILGTGSNSCFYDGHAIVAHTPALGYILGDEGSGAVLGRMFLNAVLKGAMSEEISKDFLEETGLTQTDIINKVYRQPSPNRFLASLSKYISRHLDDAALERLVVENFETFISRNLSNYNAPDNVINAVGSVAFFYKEQLRKAALNKGYEVGHILKSPMEGLLSYHFET